MTFNINRANPDPFYRYKMPRLIAKVEGRGNGIKTVVANMTEIARSLCRPPTYPTKFFGCELGAQTIFDEANERYIVNGAHEAGKLQDLLDGFIRKFVLCEKCDNPETSLTVDRKDNIHADCAACGHHYTLDSRHKLITFIINHPPGADGKATAKGSSGKKKGDKKARREEKKNKQQQAQEEKDEFDTIAAVPEDDDLEWSADTSDAAVAARLAEVEANLAHGARHFNLDDVDELTVDERLEKFYEFLKAGQRSDEEITQRAARLDLVNEGRTVGIVAEVALKPEDIADPKKVGARAGLFKPFIKKKKSQKYLLGALEMLIGGSKDLLMPKTGQILQAFYDNDLISEEAVLAWHEKPSKKYVKKDLSIKIHAAADKFVEWLKEADEESSEEEDDDLGIQFGDSGAGAGAGGADSKVASEAGGERKKVAELDDLEGADLDDCDIDIDNI